MDKLIAELKADPLRRGYADMTPDEVAASLAETDREIDPRTISFPLGLTVMEEFEGLTPDRQLLWVTFCGQQFALNPRHAFSIAMVRMIFGEGSQTLSAFMAKEPASRAVEIGLGPVKPGHVEEARRLIAKEGAVRG